jgi:hypothetical protein
LAGQRWYSPHLRRWISRDPIGYKGDDNLYDYVGQRPLNFIDPTGEFSTAAYALRRVTHNSQQNFQTLSAPLENNSEFGPLFGLLDCSSDPKELQLCLRSCDAGVSAAQAYCVRLTEPRLRAGCFAAAAGGVAVCRGYCYFMYVD